MKKIAITIIAASTLAATAVPAMAAPWQNINQRQANLDRRIDVGVRTGQLSRREATRLRGEFNSLLRLEAQALSKRLERAAQRPGLSPEARAHLDDSRETLSLALAARLQRAGL